MASFLSSLRTKLRIYPRCLPPLHLESPDRREILTIEKLTKHENCNPVYWVGKVERNENMEKSPIFEIGEIVTHPMLGMTVKVVAHYYPQDNPVEHCVVRDKDDIEYTFPALNLRKAQDAEKVNFPKR